MDSVRRYLGFVEYEENLPRKVKLNLSFFLNEICGTESLAMEDALRWARKQKGFKVQSIVDVFYNNFLATNNAEQYFLMAESCNSLMSKFGNLLTARVENALEDMFGSCRKQSVFWNLLRTMHLINGMYVHEVISAEYIYRFMCMTMKAKVENGRRIGALRELVADDAISLLKKDLIDQRFVSFLGIVRSMIESDELVESMTIEEAGQVAEALIEVNFLPPDTLQYDKIAKVENIIVSWRNGSYSLEEASQRFSALEFKYFEQFSHILGRFFSQAMIYSQNQEKLVILQKQLINGTFKDQKEIFDDALAAMMSDYIAQSFMKPEVAALDTNTVFVRYLSHLYNHSLIRHEMIRTTLGIFIRLPPNIGDPRFMIMFQIVEEKLKTDMSEEDFQLLVVHLLDTIVSGIRDPSNLSNDDKQWLRKMDKERKVAAEKLKRQQQETIKPESVSGAIESYCFGKSSIPQTLQVFEQYRTIPNYCLEIIPQQFVAFAMSNKFFHKQQAILLRNLIEQTFKDRSGELNVALFEVLQKHVKEYFEYTSKSSLSSKNCLISFLNHLFNEGVIGEELIVDSLELFVDDWEGAGETCFLPMFVEVHEKLEQKVGKKRFKQFCGYLWPSDKGQHLNEKLEEMPSSTTKPVTPKKPETPQKKNNLSRKVQKMTINMRELESAEKLSEVVVNLQKVLDSKSRMTAFIKSILERPKSDLKEILLHAKLLVALADASGEGFEFRSCLASTMHSEYLLTNAVASFNKKAKAKLNRIEVISGELWCNNLMATKKFAGLLLSKNIRYLPTESLAHLSLIVSGKMQSEGNSRLKLAVRTFEPLIHESIINDWSDMKDDLEDLETELQMLLSSEAAKSHHEV